MRSPQSKFRSVGRRVSTVATPPTCAGCEILFYLSKASPSV